MRRYTPAFCLLSSAAVLSGLALKNTVEYAVLVGVVLGFSFIVAAVVSFAKGF